MNKTLSIKMLQIFSFMLVSVLYNEKSKFSFQRKFQIDLQIIGKKSPVLIYMYPIRRTCYRVYFI